MSRYSAYVDHQITRIRSERSALEQRRNKALEVARLAAQLLRDRFGAKKVRLFGSVLKPGAFFERSDIDLAAEGIQRDDYLTALGALESVNPEFEIDLVVPGLCRAEIWQAAEREGMDL